MPYPKAATAPLKTSPLPATPHKLLGRTLTAMGAVAALLALASLVVTLVVLAVGGNPQAALSAIHLGAVGTPASVAETLVKAAPLILTGLAISVAFRAGIWNIGAEGQLLIGMLGSAAAALALPPVHPVLGASLCLLAGAAAGAAWSGLAALLKLWRGIPEVISTIMLNFIAVYLIEYLVRGPLRDPRSINDWSRPMPDWTRLPRFRELGGLRELSAGTLTLPNGQTVAALGVDAGQIHAGVLLAIGVVLAVWAWFALTGTGFRIRAVGFNPVASAAAGIPVTRTVLIAFLASGALAGLGGAVEQLSVISRLHRFAPGEPGYGFSGIAVALLGQLHPVGVLGSALFFGALSAGCDRMQRVAGINFQVAYIIQAVIILLLASLPGQDRGRFTLRRLLTRNAGSQTDPKTSRN